MKTKRYSIIGLLCLVMVFALSMFFVACDKKPDDTGSEFTQTGDYYAISGEEEWELSITEDGFNLTLLTSAGQSYSGSYTFNGSELALAAASGAKFVASVSGDGFKVTINGKEYEFLKKYTVTFTYDGGSFTKSALAGKEIDTPDNPVKEGYVFVGWYKDKSFNLSFDFKAGVKGDTTVYGKFVKQTDGEFSVDFYDGGELLSAYTAKTVQHCLGALPELTAEDKEFLGWWISDFEDSAKLTKQVLAGDEINADAKLFAVWANKNEKALAVSVNVGEDGKGKIVWTSAGNAIQYTVTISGPDGALPSEKTYLTSLTYDFNDLAAGEYEILVLSSNGVQGKAYLNNKGIPKVSGLEVSESDATLLVFNNVAEADYYLLTIVCNNAGHVHENLRLEKPSTELVTYDFSGCEMTSEGITFYVTACSGKAGKSVVSELYVMNALDNIAEIKYDSAAGTISWTDVSAEYYYVTVTCGDKKTSEKVEEATYSLGAYKGEIAVTVTGYKKGYVSTEAKEASFTRENLLMPEGLRISDGVLYWNSVEGAVSYEVKVNDKTVNATQNPSIGWYSNLASYIENLDSFTVSVKAVASDTSLNSAENTMTISKKQFTTITYKNRVLTWAPVAEAKSYRLSVNGKETTYEARSDLYSYTFENLTAGNYAVKLTAIDASNKTLDEKTLNVTFYSISFNSLGGDTTPETVLAAEGDYVELPEVTREGYDFGGWYLTEEGPTGGKKYSSDIFDGTDDLVLYAYYVPKKHLVKLQVGEYGTLADGKDTVELSYGEKFTLPVPTANDESKMVFVGWYKGLQGRDTRYTDQYGVGKIAYDNNGGMTLYAFWASVFKYEETVTEDETHSKAYRVKGGDGINFVTEVTIPESVDGVPVTTIDAGAFKNCSNLQIVNFYSSMEYVEVGDDTGANSAFEGCSSLTEINVLKSEKSDKNKYYSAKGVLCGYSKLSGMSEVLVVPSSVNGTLELPEGVEVIKSNAFNKKNISTIIIPSTVQEIQESAFEECKQLVNVIFTGSDSDKQKPLTIAKYAFKNCAQLQTVTFPARLSSFDRKAFESCTKLVSVDVAKAENEDTAYYSANGVLISGKYGTATLEYVPAGIKGEFVIPDGVTTIASLAFAGSQVTKVTIPKAVTTIEPYAFGGVTNQDGASFSGTLEGDFYAPSATRLGQVVFEGKESDKPLTIGEGAFYGTALYKNEIVLPENLVSLGKYAFGGIKNPSLINYADIEVRVETSLENAKFATGAFATCFLYNGNKIESYHVTKLTIGKNFPFMEIGGVFGDSSIKEISVDAENPNYKEKDNVLFNGDYTMIVYVPSSVTGEYVVPDTVTKIGDGVFAGKNIEKIVIPASVTEIGARAFYDARSLIEVTFEDGENAGELAIDDYAFAQCYDLATITFPARLRTIGEYAFYRCDELVDVRIPEGVTSIAGYAFAECDGLKNVYLPASLKVLGIIGSEQTGTTEETGSKLTVFKDSTAIENVEIAEGNTAMLSDDGILYVEKTQEDGKKVYELVYSPAGKTGELTLKENVSYVWDRAFYYNTKIEKITFSDSDGVDLTFGDSIFEGCWNLKALVLPVGLKKMNYGLLDGCSSLETLTVPYTVETISYGAFRRFHSSISSAMKYGCENLKTIIFQETPEGVAEVKLKIEDGAHRHSSNQLGFAVVGAFFGTAIENLTLPARTDYIGAYAFSGIKTLKSVTIPKGVTYLGQGTFFRSSVTDVIFEEGSKITAIPAYCFSETNIGGSETAKGTVNLPEGIKSIGYKAFFDCGALTSIVIPSTVEELGSGYYESDFYYNITNEDEIVLNYKKDTKGNMVAVTTVTDPDGSVFSSSNSTKCKLATVTFAKNADGKTSLEYIYSKAFYYSKLERVAIPASVKEIREEAFESISTLEEITFETYTEGENEYSDITLIGDKAFALGSAAPLTSFAFPETPQGTMTLGSSLFSGCANLSTIYLSNSVTDITGLLTGITSKKIMLSVSDDHPTLSLDKNLPFVLNKAGDTIQSVYTQVVPDNDEGLVVIPDQYTTILPQAFMGQQNIKKLVLPATMKKIASEAFKNAKGLEEVSFARDAQGKSALTYMGIDVFYGCSNLVKAEIPGELGYVPDGTFRDCKNLKELTLGEGIKSIGRIGLTVSAELSTSVRRDSLYFDEIEYSNGKLVTTQNYNGINSYVFYNCTSLTTIKTKESDPENVATLPSTVESLGNQAFASSGLISIVLPEKLTTIGDPVYWQCPAGTSAPSKKTNGTGNIFYNCKSLVSVLAKGKITKIGENAFQNCASLTTFKTKESDPDNKVTLPNTCTELAKYSFDGTGVIDFAFNKVTTLGEYVLRNTLNLETVDFGGITDLPNYTFYGSGIANVDLTGIKSLGEYTFQNCLNLKQIELPSEITTLPANVFRKTGLTSINLNNVTTLGNYAFAECADLAEVTGDSKLTSIGNYAFMSSGLTKFCALSLTAIPQNAFDGCASLKEVTDTRNIATVGTAAFRNSGVVSMELPNVTELGASAFEGCTSLKSVNITKTTNNVIVFGNTVFKNSSIENFNSDVEEDKVINLTGVKKFGTSVFEGANGFKKIVMPTWNGHEDNYSDISAYLIPGSTFKNTSAEEVDMSTIKASNLEKKTKTQASGNKPGIYQTAIFEGTANLVKVTLPEDLTIIPYNTFKNSGLKYINLGNIEEIAYSAFEGCANLVGEDEETLVLDLSNVTTLGYYAFKGCTSLTEVNLPALTSFGTKSSLKYNGETTSRYGSEAFYGCTSLKKVGLNKALTAIAVEAFGNCTALDTVYVSDATATEGTATFSDKLTAINYGAFQNTGLKKVIVSKTVKTIDNYAFADCKQLETVEFESGSVLATVGEHAFSGDASLKDVTLPDSVKTLGAYAFANCTALTGVANLPKSLATVGECVFLGTGVTGYANNSGNANFTVKDGVLYSKDGTTILSVAPETAMTITLDENTKIGDYAFAGANNLTFVFKEGFAEIADYAFMNLKTLTAVELPKTITKIGAGAFMNTALTEITLPEGLTTIGDYAFMGTGITEVTLPATLTSFGAQVFANTGVTTITIPEKVTSLKASTFEGYGKLEYLDLGSVTKLTAGVLGNAGSELEEGKSFKVIVPETVTTFPTKTFANSYVNELVINTSATTSATSLFSSSSSSPNTTLKKVTFGEGVTETASKMFQYCSALETVELPSSMTTLGEYSFSYTALKSFVVPDSITSMGKYAFAYNEQIVSFTFGNGMTETGTGYLLYCCSALEKVVLPEGYTTISQDTFYQCTALTDITIPSTVKTLGMYAFFQCTSLESVILPEECVVNNFAFRNWIKGQTIYFRGTEAFAKENWGTSFNDLTSAFAEYEQCDVVYGYKG